MSERYDLDLVVRRLVWHAEDETETQYLDDRDAWNSDRWKAWLYGSSVAFDRAKTFGGKVFIRLPSGREVNVSAADFDDEQPPPAPGRGGNELRCKDPSCGALICCSLCGKPPA